LKLNVEFIKAEIDHCAHIAECMRDCDIEEVWAASHQLPYEALATSLQMSPYAQTAILDGVPCAMYGVAVPDFMSDVGAPWMLATDDLKLWSLWFLKRSVRVIREMLECCPFLMNYVDARNETSILWLKWLGFKLSDSAIPWGADGLPFHIFQKQRSADDTGRNLHQIRRV
jgi:hypothetical protein